MHERPGQQPAPRTRRAAGRTPREPPAAGPPHLCPPPAGPPRLPPLRQARPICRGGTAGRAGGRPACSAGGAATTSAVCYADGVRLCGACMCACVHACVKEALHVKAQRGVCVCVTSRTVTTSQARHDDGCPVRVRRAWCGCTCDMMTERACVRACVRACAHACMRVCVIGRGRWWVPGAEAGCACSTSRQRASGRPPRAGRSLLPPTQSPTSSLPPCSALLVQPRPLGPPRSLGPPNRHAPHPPPPLPTLPPSTPPTRTCLTSSCVASRVSPSVR
jgi:hypothetical protein